MPSTASLLLCLLLPTRFPCEGEQATFPQVKVLSAPEIQFPLDTCSPEFKGLRVQFAPCRPEEEWDAFVGTQPGGQLEQTTGFVRIKELSGWQPWLLKVRSPSGIVGGGVVLRRSLGPFQLSYLSRGPVCRTDGLSARATSAALQVLGARLRIAYFAVVPPFHGEHLTTALNSYPWVPKPATLPPSSLVVATLLLDLKPELDVLLGNMRTTTRQCVRRGLREGVQVTPEGREALDRFWNLMAATCARRGLKPQPSSSRYFHNLWDALGAAGHVQVFMGRLQGEDVCGAFAFSFGRTFMVWKVGWSGAHERKCPNYALWWECMRWARSHGFAEMDFVGILPHHAAAILRGETVDDDYWGVTAFKLGFGGKLVFSPPHLYQSFYGPARLAFRCGGGRLLASNFGSRVLNAIHHQQSNA